MNGLEWLAGVDRAMLKFGAAAAACRAVVFVRVLSAIEGPVVAGVPGQPGNRGTLCRRQGDCARNWNRPTRRRTPSFARCRTVELRNRLPAAGGECRCGLHVGPGGNDEMGDRDCRHRGGCRRDQIRGPRSQKRVRTRAAAHAGELNAQRTSFVKFSATRTVNWRSRRRAAPETAVQLARRVYETRDFDAMPILADALRDAGCERPDILNHCRDASAAHTRGCWVLDDGSNRGQAFSLYR